MTELAGGSRRSGWVRSVLSGNARAALNRGNIIDVATKNKVGQLASRGGLRGLGLSRLEMPGLGRFGRDFFNPRTMRAWDMTTIGQWEAHITKYIEGQNRNNALWRQLMPLIH